MSTLPRPTGKELGTGSRNGNDETHYLRKWADRDVDDLVGLIKLAMHWIEIDHLSKSCVKEMPSK